MNQQEIFDTCASHLLTQLARSVGDDNFTCKYRGKNGLKCAVGILIPDEVYDPQMEMTVGTLIELMDEDKEEILHALDPTIFNESNQGLLSSIQTIHDTYYEYEQWPGALKDVATRFKLEYKGYPIAGTTS